MHKVLKLALVFFLSLPLFSSAQNKYAVLLAVNDYYQAPGVKSDHSLTGCINDAQAIKALLMDRFQFSEKNIFKLYNADATKKNFVDLMYKLLHTSQPGDAVVFYYSGHGVWMSNDQLMQDPVKRGMSQAIVMSDLYSPGWNCLVRDETLKEIFNQFVTKKIVFTAIFDCCFGANLAANFGVEMFWTPPVESYLGRDMQPEEIPYFIEVREPKGCKLDSFGRVLDTTDIDLDGVPDCADWELFTPRNSSIDGRGVAQGANRDGFNESPDNYYDDKQFATAPTNNEKSYNLKDAIRVSNKSSVRPADREHSMFLSFSGTQDNEKGLEMTNAAGERHGLFTAALLEVYRSNVASLSFYEVMNKTSEIMKQQGFSQSPGYHCDIERFKKNLVGINSVGFSEKLKVVCISNNNGIITVDKGTVSGVLKGNIFSDASGNQVEIQNASAQTATAIDKTRGQIKPGQVLELKDDYTITQPLLKVYIPSVSFTPESFQNFCNKKIIPLTKTRRWSDYNNPKVELEKQVIIWKDGSSYKKIPSNEAPNTSLVVLLPMPSFISDKLKGELRKDQNIEVVNSPEKADYAVYLNYSVPGKYVFYIHPVISEVQWAGGIFSKDHGEVPALSSKNISIVTSDLHRQLKMLYKSVRQGWINYYPRR